MKNNVERRGPLRCAVVSLAVLGAVALSGVSPGTAAAPDKVERGRYLANQVATCMGCHSERNWAYYAGPITPGTEGKGAKLDYLGLDFSSTNITPAGIGDWTDKELAQALTVGKGKGGAPVHAFLPNHQYGEMAPDDVEAVIAYLRTLPSIPVEAPKAAAPAGKKAAAKAHPYKPQPRPNPADTVASGKYLVMLADCQFCHNDNFAGGKKFQIPGRDPIVSLNISPTSGSATGGKPRDSFIGRFKAFASDGARRLRAPAGNPSSVMPWTDLARMSDEDLGAIYDYLKTVPPVSAAPPANGKQ